MIAGNAQRKQRAGIGQSFLFPCPQNESDAGSHSVRSDGDGNVVTVVGADGSEAQRATDTSSLEHILVGTVADDRGDTQRFGQAQIACPIVTFDGQDGDVEPAQFQAQT